MIKRIDIEAIETLGGYIVSHVEDHLTIDQLARRGGINKKKVKSGFRLLYGMGAYSYLKSQRMEKAKNLLVSTDKTLRDIALEIGYKSISSFSTAFRKCCQLSPKEWRNIHQPEAALPVEKSTVR